MKIINHFEEIPEKLLKLYNNNQYMFKAPPVCSNQWNKKDWINYMISKDIHGDKNGKMWFIKDNKHYFIDHFEQSEHTKTIFAECYRFVNHNTKAWLSFEL